MDEKTAIRKVSALRKRDEIELEDLLALLKTPSPFLSDPLKKLAGEEKWEGLNDRLVTPFTAWVDVICAYCENGMPAIKAMAKKGNHLSHLALGVLETLNNQESAETLIDLLEAASFAYHEEYLQKLVSTFNLVVTFSKTVNLTEKDRERSRDVLVTVLAHADISNNATLQALCLYALRKTGDEATIETVKARQPLPEPWLGTEKRVIQQIRKNIKSRK